MTTSPQQLAPLYTKLFRAASKLQGQPSLYYRNLMKSINHVKGHNHRFRLVVNIKRHKPNGEDEVRNTHASPRYSFAGLSVCVSRRCEQHFQRADHLLQVTECFVARVSKLAPLNGTIMVKAGIRDFYMSGKIDDLVEHAASIMTGNKPELVRGALYSLIGNQEVHPDCDADPAWRVTQGSGIGPRRQWAAGRPGVLGMRRTLVPRARVLQARPPHPDVPTVPGRHLHAA